MCIQGYWDEVLACAYRHIEIKYFACAYRNIEIKLLHVDKGILR